MKQIFIGGTGRSGTSIFKKVLLQHSEIVGVRQELRILIDPDGVLDLGNTLVNHWTPQAADLALSKFRSLYMSSRKSPAGYPLISRFFDLVRLSTPRYLGLGLEADFGAGEVTAAFDDFVNSFIVREVRGRWIGSPAWQFPTKLRETEPVSNDYFGEKARSTIDQLYRNLDSSGAVKAWVDDTPFNVLRARELLSVFPDMLLVNIYRDPRDVAASYLTKSWGGGEAKAAAQRVNCILDRWLEIKKCLPPTQVIDISLEELSADSASMLELVMERSGLRYEASMEAVKLDKVNSGRWRLDLSSEDCAVVCNILEKHIEN